MAESKVKDMGLTDPGRKVLTLAEHECLGPWTADSDTSNVQISMANSTRRLGSKSFNFGVELEFIDDQQLVHATECELGPLSRQLD